MSDIGGYVDTVVLAAIRKRSQPQRAIPARKIAKMTCSLGPAARASPAKSGVKSLLHSRIAATSASGNACQARSPRPDYSRDRGEILSALPSRYRPNLKLLSRKRPQSAVTKIRQSVSGLQNEI